MNSVLKFKKKTDEGNYLGFDIIEILSFNFDGEGSALCLTDGELEIFSKTDIFDMVYGFVRSSSENAGPIQDYYNLL